jgi:hypothetical protein
LHEALRCGPQEFPYFFKHSGEIFPIEPRCVAQSMLEFSCIFGKFSGNISNILCHDVRVFLKLRSWCDWNLPFSWYFSCILVSFASICVVQNVAKIHAKCMWFEFCLITPTNASTSFWYFSCQSTFDCNVQGLPWNLDIPFLL